MFTTDFNDAYYVEWMTVLSLDIHNFRGKICLALIVQYLVQVIGYEIKFIHMRL